jgi:hypothetical protein
MMRECGALDWKVRGCELKDECERYGEDWRRGWIGGDGDGVWPPQASELSSAFFIFFSLFDHKLECSYPVYLEEKSDYLEGKKVIFCFESIHAVNTLIDQ